MFAFRQKPALLVLAGSLACAFGATGAEGPSFQGRLSTEIIFAAAQTNQFLFTRKAGRLRIENTDKSRPEPVNIIELDSGRETILFPHNSSFMRIDPAKSPMQPGGVALPPGAIPPSVNPRPFPALPSGVPAPPQLPAGIGPQAQASGLPALPVPPAVGGPAAPTGLPPMPSAPSLGSQQGIGLPAMAFPMPNIPFPGEALDLTKTDTNRTILGFACTRYTLTNRLETLEIWAIADAALFPFRLLDRDYSHRRFGPALLEEQWSEILRKKSLFPLEATLRNVSGVERFSFKVTAIEKKQISEESRLFTVPEGFYETEPPPF